MILKKGLGNVEVINEIGMNDGGDLFGRILIVDGGILNAL